MGEEIFEPGTKRDNKRVDVKKGDSKIQWKRQELATQKDTPGMVWKKDVDPHRVHKI